MKILALVTARGGSVRLPGKNLRPLGGKPLINWSIEIVQDISEICEVLVSTDNESIADVSREAGALVPWLRPQELSTNEASSVDVALHALNWYEAEKGIVDGLLLLQPTSPFRTNSSIRSGIELYKANCRETVIGVSPTSIHPKWAFVRKGNYLQPFIKKSIVKESQQNLEEVLNINGNFYLISPENLRKNRSFFEGKLVPHVNNSKIETIDIDYPEDFLIAELYLKYILEKNT
jgi:CMP-N,N'-diacetyllegionaminic acid synthase